MTHRITDERLAEIEKQANANLAFGHAPLAAMLAALTADLRDERAKVAELEKTLDKIATAMGTTREALIKDANSTEPPPTPIVARY